MDPGVLLSQLKLRAGATRDRSLPSGGFGILRYENFGVLPFLSDILGILGAACLGGMIYDDVAKRDPSPAQHLSFGLAFAAVFILIGKLRGLYSVKCLLSPSHLQRLVSAWMWSCLILMTLLFLSRHSDNIPRGVAFIVLLLACVLMTLCRAGVAGYVRLALAKGWLRRVKIILIGSRKSIQQNASMLSAIGFAIVEKFEIERAAPTGCINAVLQRARASDIDEIHLALDGDRTAVLGGLVEGLRSLPVTVRWIPDCELAEFLTKPISLLASQPSFKLHRPPLSDIERFIKRVFDVTAAVFLLAVLAPLLALVAIAITLDSPGPAVFLQRRRGFNGRPFRIMKFRTMTTTEDGDTIRQAIRNDARVTRVGRLLRRTSIDELPQLLNVIRGEMSLVGPRPHAVAHDDEYGDKISRYANRHHVKPGITGWAQVNGARGETSSIAGMVKRVELDLWYVSNWSMLLDFWIVIRTAGSLLNTKNTY